MRKAWRAASGTVVPQAYMTQARMRQACMTRAWMTTVLVAAFLLPGWAVEARDPIPEPDCYDAVVLAKIARQTPTVVPDCGEDCIVMRWPWIVDLDVMRVVDGTAPTGRVTVLTIQHTYYRDDGRALQWQLRRNALGVFNVVTPAQGAKAALCPAGHPAARPYISPEAGKTLRDLRLEGARIDGREP